LKRLILLGYLIWAVAGLGQTNSSIGVLDGIVLADQYSSTQAAIAALPSSGGVVYLSAQSAEHSCPTSIPSNVALVGLNSFADSTIIGTLGMPNVTTTQVRLGPCGAITIAAGAQNIRLQNLTLDFNNSGNGLIFESASGVQLYGVSLIKAGNASTPALSFGSETSASSNSAQNTVEHVAIQCNVSTPCLAGIYLNGQGATFVTNNIFTDITITGAAHCGIDLEANTDTNQWFGGKINLSSLTPFSAAFCFNFNNPTVDVDANANNFYGWEVTGNVTYYWRAGVSSGHVFYGINSPPPPSNFNSVGGTATAEYPAVFTETLGAAGITQVQVAQVNANTLDQISASRFAGVSACSGSTKTIAFPITYSSQPAVFIFDETTAGGIHLTARSTAGFTASCSGASDSFDWMVVGNPN